MYHSKNSSASITLPRNYRGNAFVADEQECEAPKLASQDKTAVPEEALTPCVSCESDTTNSLFSGISTEDLLLLGLILVIKDSNPNDPVLLLLLILLLTK